MKRVGMSAIAHDDRFFFFQGGENSPADTQRVGFYGTLDEFTESAREPYSLVDDDHTPREIPYLLPRQEVERPSDYQSYQQPPPTISVPIIAFLDPAKISDDKIDVPIAATISRPDDVSNSRLDLLENNREGIQRNVQDYIDGNSWSVDPEIWRFTSPPSQVNLFGLIKYKLIMSCGQFFSSSFSS